MKVFILERVEKLTYNYHSEGGLVVIAKDLESAKVLVSSDEDIQSTNEEWSSAKVYDLKDENAVATYYIFPDAGCC